MDAEDYDVQGLFKGVKGADLPVGHGTDRYKKPNHPTFSIESVYNSPKNPGGRWAVVAGKPVFYASDLNVKNLGVQGLRDYFIKYEPGVQLVMPHGMSLKDLLKIP